MRDLINQAGVEVERLRLGLGVGQTIARVEWASSARARARSAIASSCPASLALVGASQHRTDAKHHAFKTHSSLDTIEASEVAYTTANKNATACVYF